MAVRMEFRLSDRDFDKLHHVKKVEGETNMTYNDYAEMLLSDLIDRKYREYKRKDLIKNEED